MLETDFPVKWTHRCHYFMTPHGGSYDMNVGHVNRKELAEEVDSGKISDGGQKSIKLRDVPNTFSVSFYNNDGTNSFLYSCEMHAFCVCQLDDLS